ncbi:MAG: molybdopterin-dependent oxidoreductase [Bacteroidota bacterium]|jgi:formate dehydrogenase major subunit|nr:molybdopterin-dependent oxidoreductase [Bacteroidota bacterium]
MVTLTINGKQVTASPDRTILQVCHDQDIDHIPTLCYDEKLPPFGACFLCVVEVEGQSRLFPACSTKVQNGMVINTASQKVRRARKTCLELIVSNHYADCFGPCRLNCPADVDIQGYMSLISMGKFKEAVALIKEKNPLPSVCGRVCTRKCEVNCRRTLVDSPVGIDFLKRYVADQDMIGDMWKPDVKEDNGVRVAIIGGGPAGLTAAYYLAIEGYRPVIFEALPHLGGMLRYGIPEYRLPKDVLDKEINWITDLGVEVHTERKLGRDFTMDDLFDQGFRSVFVGLGAQVGKPMAVENEEAEGVLSGVDFLRQVEMKTQPDIKGRVVVVGGGNTAIDAARTSLRLGAEEVVLLYRRTRKEMPANEMEIVAAEEEGVTMEFLAAPVRVNVEENRMKSIRCIRMELGEPDASGRRRPVVIEGSDFDLACDWVISAIGQEPDLDGVTGDEKIAVTRWKTIEAKAGTFDTDRPGVFSGGDVVTGPADAIDAIAAGRMAARAIDKYLQTGIVEPLTDRFESKRDNFHKLTREDIPLVKESHRHHAPEVPAAERIKGFMEVEHAYDDKTAFEEALRCAECGCDAGLSCRLQDYCTEYGVDQTRFVGEFNRYQVDTRHPFIKIDSNKCINCGRCVNTCAEILNVSALGFVNRGFRTIVKPAMEKALHETNCVSCGNCIDVCPTGTLVEKMPFRRSGPWQMDAVFNICNYCSVGCNITMKVKAPDLFYVTGAAPDMGPNYGELCVRGRFGYQQYLDGSRIKRPMVRRNGELVTATWDEAFEAIHKGRGRILEDYGADAMLVSASPKLTDEELYLAGRYARTALGTNNLASFHQLVSGAEYHALDDMLGATLASADLDDLEHADLYLVLGGNPTIDNPVMGWRMKRRMRHGTQAIVINSAEIDLVPHATLWADPRRGTATRLLNGVIAELVRRGAINTDFIARRTVNFDQVATQFASEDLHEVAHITGVSEAKIHAIADLLADPEKKIVAWYNFDSRLDRASEDLKALATLMLMLGKVGVRGSGIALFSGECNHTGMQIAGFDRQLLPGGANIRNARILDAVSRHWKHDIAPVVAGGTNLSRALREDRIRGAFMFGENPAVAEEYHGFVNNLEFLVVADMFLTETAQAADVVLPLSAYWEGEGHFTNWAGARQKTHAIGEPLGGMATVEIFRRLLEMEGCIPSFDAAAEVSDELLAFIRQQGSEGRIDLAFPTADGKAHFVSYAAQVLPTGARVPSVLESDARMNERLSRIHA